MERSQKVIKANPAKRTEAADDEDRVDSIMSNGGEGTDPEPFYEENSSIIGEMGTYDTSEVSFGGDSHINQEAEEHGTNASKSVLG